MPEQFEVNSWWKKPNDRFGYLYGKITEVRPTSWRNSIALTVQFWDKTNANPVQTMMTSADVFTTRWLPCDASEVPLDWGEFQPQHRIPNTPNPCAEIPLPQTIRHPQYGHRVEIITDDHFQDIYDWSWYQARRYSLRPLGNPIPQKKPRKETGFAKFMKKLDGKDK